MNHGFVAQEIGRPEAETSPLQPAEVRSFNLHPSQCCSVQHPCCVSHFNQVSSFNCRLYAGEAGKTFSSLCFFFINLTIEEVFLDDTQSVMINS